MRLEIEDKEGVFGTIEVTPEIVQELKEALGLGAASVESEAQFKESQGKVGEMEEKLTKAEARTMDSYSPREKADFVIAWAKELSAEDKAIFAEGTGITIAPEVEPKAEVAESKAEVPMIIKGPTDLPGYKYFEHLGISVKQKGE